MNISKDNFHKNIKRGKNFVCSPQNTSPLAGPKYGNFMPQITQIIFYFSGLREVATLRSQIIFYFSGLREVATLRSQILLLNGIPQIPFVLFKNEIFK
jgi:hypothetical protein